MLTADVMNFAQPIAEKRHMDMIIQLATEGGGNVHPFNALAMYALAQGQLFGGGMQGGGVLQNHLSNALMWMHPAYQGVFGQQGGNGPQAYTPPNLLAGRGG